MRRTTTLLLALVLSTLALGAQHPAAARIDATRLARLDGLLQQYVDENRIGGAVAVVLHNGKVVYDKAFGWRDKEAGVRMTTDSMFRIASQTKAITSTAVLMLVEEGRIGLLDPVSRFIPPFATTTVAALRPDGGVDIVPAKRPITITDLLTHTAGISYGTSPHVASLYEAKQLGPAAGMGWYTADKTEPVCDTMERLATLPFVSQPGDAWVYGYNTDILGCVVERASGVPLDVFFRTRIFGPLGMTDTQFFVPADKKNRLVVVYSSGPDGTIVRAPEGSRGPGALRGRTAEELRGRRGARVDRARLHALPRDDQQRRRGGGRTSAVAEDRSAHDAQPLGAAALGSAARVRPRFRDDGDGRRQRTRSGWLVRVGRRVRVDVPRRSDRRPRDLADDQSAAAHGRHPDEVPDAGAPGGRRALRM